MSPRLKQLQVHWKEIEPVLSIKTERDYDRAITQLNELLDEVGSNGDHPLYELLDTLGVLIHAYEEQALNFDDVSGVDVLEALIEEHGLKQLDLPEIGSQGVVSEILNGKRELNVRQIKALSIRFGVSPSVFI